MTILRLQNHLLIRNTLINLAGYGAPLLVALFALPVLVARLGTERFGVLTLAWVFIGYLGLFDLGLSRALTKLVAEKIGQGDHSSLVGLVWTGIILMAGMGVLIGSLIAALTPLAIHRFLTPPADLTPEIIHTFIILSLSMPVVIVSIGLRGVLDAWQRFDLSNAVRVPLGIFVFVAPLLVIPFTLNLAIMITVLMAGRLLALGVQYRFCCHLMPALKQKMVFDHQQVKPLLHFGGWMTVTNIINPLMLHSDRFFIAALYNLTAVTFYATPHEIVTKFFLIPTAIMGVFFPAFATSQVQSRENTAALFKRGIQIIWITMLPLCLITALFAREGLAYWMGEAFAIHSAPVLTWLNLGIFMFCLAQVPYSLIQGLGRPDLTARLHLLEFPFFIILMIWLTTVYGIVGSAIAWCLRMGVEVSALLFMTRGLVSETRSSEFQIGMMLITGLVLLGGAGMVAALHIKFILAALILLLWALGAWRVFRDLRHNG